MSEEKFDPELIKKVEARMKWVKHSNKKILYQDYTNLDGDEIAELIPIFTYLELQYKEIDRLQLLNFTNSYASKPALNALSEAARVTKHLYTKTAVLGITGVKKILLNMLNRITSIGAKAFATEEKAKNWLIS